MIKTFQGKGSLKKNWFEEGIKISVARPRALVQAPRFAAQSHVYIGEIQRGVSLCSSGTETPGEPSRPRFQTLLRAGVPLAAQQDPFRVRAWGQEAGDKTSFNSCWIFKLNPKNSSASWASNRE